MKHTRTPVSLTVRGDRGTVIVRWGEDGVLRSRSFGKAVDPDAWYDAIHFYLSKIILRDLSMLLGKKLEHIDFEKFTLRTDDINHFLAKGES